jgi:hypothetical protein
MAKETFRHPPDEDILGYVILADPIDGKTIRKEVVGKISIDQSIWYVIMMSKMPLVCIVIPQTDIQSFYPKIN